MFMYIVNLPFVLIFSCYCSNFSSCFVIMIQLKKVRLRTTFASTDTSHTGVQLSCCEHYGNVLNEYSRQELQAVSSLHASVDCTNPDTQILDVATRKKPFLQSNVISQYKEVCFPLPPPHTHKCLLFLPPK